MSDGTLDERVSGYLTSRHRLDEVEVQVLSGDASTRRYFRVVGPEGSAVLALNSEPFDPALLPFVAVQRLMVGWGLPVPAILDTDGARGILLLEDLGDVMLQDALTASPSRTGEYYARATEQIAQLQREAARGPADAPCFQVAFDADKLEWELLYFLKHFVEGHRQTDVTVDDRMAVGKEFRALAEEIASWPRVLCHRDYHSRNLMVNRDELYWVDFQDARMGPATYDLASLLRDSYVDLDEGFIREAAESFRRRALPGEPSEVFARRFDLMCIQRNLKALGTFGYMDVVRGNKVYLQYVPRTLAHARRNLVGQPEMAGLHGRLARYLPELA